MLNFVGKVSQFPGINTSFHIKFQAIFHYENKILVYVQDMMVYSNHFCTGFKLGYINKLIKTDIIQYTRTKFVHNNLSQGLIRSEGLLA